MLSETASIIDGMPDEMFNQFGVSRRALLELSDNLKKCKEYFSGLLFTHKEYYDSMRAKLSFLVLETYEHSARQIGKSVDDLILFMNAVLSNDITELLRAKQEFRSHISGFITKDQEQTLDEYMTKVAEALGRNTKARHLSNLVRKHNKRFSTLRSTTACVPRYFLFVGISGIPIPRIC